MSSVEKHIAGLGPNWGLQVPLYSRRYGLSAAIGKKESGLDRQSGKDVKLSQGRM